MDRDEEAQHAAEHAAAGLHRLGWETGAGAAIWGRAVEDVLVQHEEARRTWDSHPDRLTWERLHATALLLVVVIDQILAFEERVRRLTADAELQKARKRFDTAGPDARDLRDLVTHLDAYAVGEGWRQTGQKKPEITDPSRPSSTGRTGVGRTSRSATSGSTYGERRPLPPSLLE